MSAPWNSAMSSITTLEVDGGPSGTALRSSGQPAAGVRAARSSTRRRQSSDRARAQLREEGASARRFEAKLHYMDRIRVDCFCRGACVRENEIPAVRVRRKSSTVGSRGSQPYHPSQPLPIEAPACSKPHRLEGMIPHGGRLVRNTPHDPVTGDRIVRARAVARNAAAGGESVLMARRSMGKDAESE